MTQDDISYAFRGNVESFFEISQAALPMLKSSDAGRIIGLGSFTSHVFQSDMPQFPASAASKGAIEVAVRSMSLALAQDGITVNCVVPGYIAKDPGTSDSVDAETQASVIAKIPMGRMGKPDDVAAMICFLLSPACGYVTGQVIHVNGGICA
jgi:3-oxoacyl-[acyl-carrier protein] reductase